MALEISRVDKTNWEQALSLSEGNTQTAFLPPVANSLAEAYVKPQDDEDIEAYVVKADDVVVGFYLLHFPRDGKSYLWLSSLIIDHLHQRKGYGREAISGVLYSAKKNEGCKFVGLAVNPNNHVALTLYKKMGFVDTGQRHDDGDIVMKYMLPMSQTLPNTT